MSLKSLIQSFSPKPLPSRVFSIFYVRTGEYVPYAADLTTNGASQAAAAGNSIAQRLNGRSVAVVKSREGDNTSLLRPCYGQTADIIAGVIGGAHRVRTGIFHLFPHIGVDKYELQRLHQQTKDSTLSCVVVVENGSAIGDLLLRNHVTYDGSDGLGPRYGSVHEYQMTYDPRTGSIVSAQFV